MNDHFLCPGADGNTIYVHTWEVESAQARVVIAHGAAEHGERYARFARALVAARFSVYAPDHRGHGRTVGRLDEAGNAGPDGFNGMIRDLRSLVERLHGDVLQAPTFLVGQSMGAVLVQRFIQLHGAMLAGAVLLGSPGIRPNLEAAARLTAEAASGAAGDRTSELFKQSFAAFNRGFEPVVTGYEWLSRDPFEVRKYIDDPWCGFPFTNRLVAEMAACAAIAADPKNIALIPRDLPILLIAGSHDRVGGNGEYVRKLAAAYREASIHDVELTLYPEGRHEMLNETNREDVERDILGWMASRMGRGG